MSLQHSMKDEELRFLLAILNTQRKRLKRSYPLPSPLPLFLVMKLLPSTRSTKSSWDISQFRALCTYLYQQSHCFTGEGFLNKGFDSVET